MAIYIDADARDRTSTDTTSYKSTISYKPTDIKTVQLVELTDECIEKIVNKIKPVVRGEWVKFDEGDCHCSECQFVLEDWTQGIFYNYCPNCGSDMRERRKDDKERSD